MLFLIALQGDEDGDYNEDEDADYTPGQVWSVLHSQSPPSCQSTS